MCSRHSQFFGEHVLYLSLTWWQDFFSKFEKANNDLKSASTSADLQSKKQDKRVQAEQTLEKLQEYTKECLTKALAAFIVRVGDFGRLM